MRYIFIKDLLFSMAVAVLAILLSVAVIVFVNEVTSEIDGVGDWTLQYKEKDICVLSEVTRSSVRIIAGLPVRSKDTGLIEGSCTLMDKFITTQQPKKDDKGKI